jgi:predicted phage baseplate assembly protein
LTIPNPTLDDTSFEQLVDEAKKKIQVYSSVWTDWNYSDPGITFIELFAWLADMQIYSLNRITEKNYLRFLKLLGVTLRPLNTPKVDISLNTDLNAPAIMIKKGTKFKADTPSEYNTDIIYETSDDDICLTPFSIKRILSHSNFQAKEIKEASKIEGAYFYAFGEIPHVGNAFYLGLDGINPDNKQKCFGSSSVTASETESEKPAKLLISIYLYEKDLPPLGDHGSEKPEVYLSTKVRWEYSTRDKYGNLCWEEIKKSKHHLRDTTKELTHSGKISFRIPFRNGDERNIVLSSLESRNRNRSSTDNDRHTNLFWIRCLLIEGNYEISPRIDAILPNTVSAIYGATVEEPLINISNNSNGQGDTKSTGFPDQVFSVGGVPKPNIPIIELFFLYSLHAVDGKDTYCSKWEQVNDFDSSTPDDYHYVVNMPEGKVGFGNGANGRIPDKGDMIIMRYRFGAASATLIKPETGFTSVNDNSIQVLSGINPLASSPRTDQETIEEAQTRARNDLKTPFKAVSSSEYECIAKLTPGLRVARAKAIPSSEPGSNTVKLVVVPFSLSKLPTSSNGFLRTVAKHLDKHRLITTKVIVVGPRYIGVSVTVSLTIEDDIDAHVVKGGIRKALDDFLTPISDALPQLTTICNTQNGGWPFGKAVYKSEIYAQIDAVPGVDNITNLSLSVSSRNDASLDTEGNIIIKETDLVYLDKYSVTIE